MSNTQFVMHKGENLCLLVDNGSVRNHAALFTRKLAENLSKVSGREVVAVSQDHSYRIPIEKLNGMPVPILKELLSELENRSHLRSLTVFPLLMVSGGAIFQKIESQIEGFRKRRPDVSVKMAGALIDRSDDGPLSIPAMLAGGIKKAIEREQLQQPDVIVVDHGSPFPVAAEARNWVAAKVERRLLPAQARKVLAASMERRPGPEFDFNEPLLDSALRNLAESGSETVIIAKLLLQPGKHSGRRGDIDGIVDGIREVFPAFNVIVQKQSFLLKDLIKLLLDRLEKVAD